MAKTAHADTFVRDNLPPDDELPVFLREPPYDYPERLNCADLLDNAALRSPSEELVQIGKPWFMEGDGWTYDDMQCVSNIYARVLADDPEWTTGTRVLLHAVNGPETVAAWFGIVKAGGVVVATMPLLRAGELAKIVDKAEVQWAIADAALREATDGAAEATGKLQRRFYMGEGGDLEVLASGRDPAFEKVDTAADDPVLIAFTSGTTGEPKGCVQTHRDVLAMVDGFSQHVLRPGAEDVFAGTPPFAFTFGLGALMIFPIAAGASIVFPEEAGFEGLCKAIQYWRVTTLFTAPTGYRALLKLADQYDLSSLRKCVSAGEPLPAATSDAWFEKTGVRIIDGIGATEMMHIFISAPPDAQRPGATGKPVPGYVAEVQDEHGRALPVGEVGRLAVRGPTGCRYLADPRQRQYVRNGWNMTGDLYRVDADGYFHFVSRADDLIVSSGYNIAAPEVENALLTHPAVAECAVIGAPCEERGQIPKAFVVLRDPAAASDALRAELQAHVKATIAPYKYPRALEFVDALPKTPTGKLQRFRLKET